MDSEMILDREERARISRCGWFVFVLFVTFMVCTNGIVIAISSFMPSVLNNMALLYIIQYVSIYGIALPIAYLFLMRVPKEPLQKRSLSPKAFFVFLFLAIGCMRIGATIGNLLMLLPQMFFGIENPLQSLQQTGSIWFSGLITVVVAPIGEEFIFRKCLLDRIHRYGTLAAVGLSALFFALFHQNLYQFFYAFLLGAILGYLYEKTGKLSYCILLHSSVNFICGFLVLLLSEISQKEWLLLSFFEKEVYASLLFSFGLSVVVELIELLCVVFVIVFFAFFWKKKVNLSKGNCPFPTKYYASALLKNPGVSTAVCFSVLLIILSIIPI